MTTGQIIYLLIALCGAIAAVAKYYMAAQHQTTERLDAHGERLSKLEERSKHAPTHEDMGKLHDKMNELNRTQAHMAGVLEGILTTNQMIVKRAMKVESHD